MGAIGTFNSLNNHILKGSAPSGIELTYDTLMKSSDDETATNYGLIAESAEIDPNNEFVIFNINKSARFSDGSEVTADDVAYSFNTMMEKAHPQYKLYYGEIDTPEVLSKYQVKFPFKNSKNKELKYILGQLPIISKAYWEQEENDFSKSTLTPPVYSGPYAVEKIDAGRSITYKRRDDYWGKDLPVNKGKYNFDEVKVEYYRDSNAVIESFKAGKLDLRYENVAKNWATAYNIPAIEEGRIKKEKIYHEIPTGMQAFVFNTRLEKFQNRNVRKALSLAMDFEWMNKNLFYGTYTRSDSYFENSIYAANYENDGLPSETELEILEQYRDQLPPEVFTTKFTLPESDGSGRIRERLLEARDILQQEGWEVKNGKLTNQQGEVMSIEFLIVNGSAINRLIPPMQENLRILGVQTSVKEADTSSYKKKLDDFDFDMIVGLWGQSNSPGNEQTFYWHSSSADVNGSRNFIGIKNPVVDALVEKISTAQSKDELVNTVRALDRVLLWNYYTIPQFYAGYFRILHWDKYEKPETLPKYDNSFGMWTWWAK